MIVLTLKSQVMGFLVGVVVVLVWAALDWFSSKHGLPVNPARNYSDVLFGATAGAGAVFLAQFIRTHSSSIEP